MKIAVIADSSRPGSNSEAVARWVFDLARNRTDAEFELIDFGDYHLPVLDELIPPSLEKCSQPHTKEWAAKIAAFDGYVFVTPEYDNGTSMAQKNAIGYLIGESSNKAAGLVSQGNGDGVRTTSATMRAQVTLSSFTDFDSAATFQPNPRHEQEVHAMLDQVIACSRMGRVVSEWYALNPSIRRLWMYEAGETDPDDARSIHVIVALTPTCDSDDTSPIWLARCTGWQRHLQSLIGHRVHLDWLDGDNEVVQCEAGGSEDARVCLASIDWRE